jgi:hypothetical protein
MRKKNWIKAISPKVTIAIHNSSSFANMIATLTSIGNLNKR